MGRLDNSGDFALSIIFILEYSFECYVGIECVPACESVLINFPSYRTYFFIGMPTVHYCVGNYSLIFSIYICFISVVLSAPSIVSFVVILLAPDFL